MNPPVALYIHFNNLSYLLKQMDTNQKFVMWKIYHFLSHYHSFINFLTAWFVAYMFLFSWEL